MFIDFNFNSKEAHNYLTNTRGYTISESLIRKFYTKIRRYIYLYYIIEYETEPIGEINAHNFYALDESLFSHDINGRQLWVLGLTETSSKDFRVVLTRERDGETLKKFVTKLISTGNNLVTDGWHGYDWANNINSGYERFIHNHGRNDFGRGVESTSHMESVWGQIKKQIFSIYKMIPSENLLFFIKEAEWKIKKKLLSFDEKLEDFFSMYNLVQLVGEENIGFDEFLNNEEINF